MVRESNRFVIQRSPDAERLGSARGSIGGATWNPFPAEGVMMAIALNKK
jgi:hypothetical protein